MKINKVEKKKTNFLLRQKQKSPPTGPQRPAYD